jgi:hypothetical protein
LDFWRDEHTARGFTLKLTIEGMEKAALLINIECNPALEALFATSSRRRAAQSAASTAR